MLVLAIALGVFGIGTILSGYSVIKREMNSNYMGTVPASATIELEDSIPKGLVESVLQFPSIEAAERHATISARMKVGDKWYPLLLFVVDDFKNKKTNKPSHLSGEVVPATGSMLVERTAFSIMQAKEGDELLVKIPNSVARSIKLSGTVHDPSLAPAYQEQTGYGYMTLSTLHQLDSTKGFDQLRLLVSEKKHSREHITAKAQEVAALLSKSGYTVHEIQVPPPGKHPHQGQVTTIMSVFIIFSFLVLALGSILVATSIATLMVKQTRQIGVMKTIGARSIHIIKMYGLMVLILCVAALFIAIPLSRVAGAVFYQQIAALLNLEITNSKIPFWVAMLQVASGIIVPLLVTAIPVIRGSRISVRKAIDNIGVSDQAQQRPSSLAQFSFASGTFKLSLRNVFRQRSRLTMTLSLLAAGGAMFMTALNVSDAWDKNLERIYEQRLYDLEVKLNTRLPSQDALDKVQAIAGVTSTETWLQSPTAFKTNSAFDVTQTYPDKGHGSFSLLALPLSTRLLKPTVIKGRWLNDPAANEVVLNQLATSKAKKIELGDKIFLSAEGIQSEWKVVGFTEDVGSPATAYVSLEAFSKLQIKEATTLLRIAYADRSRSNAYTLNKEVENLLERENISVKGTVPVWLLYNAIAGHMKVLVNSLMSLAVLMALVGIMGLMSTMSMNLLERTREIGVMRAIGATPSKIKNMVVWEGWLIGFFSIFIAFALSLLLSTFLGRLIGSMAFGTPLSLDVSWMAFVWWLTLVAGGAYVATLYPAKRASKITTREALAYE